MANRHPRVGYIKQEIYETLYTKIVSGFFVHGQKIPTENDLIKTYGVSRVVVREVIAKLQTAGVVITKHGIGSFAVNLASDTIEDRRKDLFQCKSKKDVIDLWEVRVALQANAFALAVERRSEEDLSSLKFGLDVILQASENELIDAVNRFHLNVARAARSPHLFAAISSLIKITECTTVAFSAQSSKLCGYAASNTDKSVYRNMLTEISQRNVSVACCKAQKI